MALTVAELAFVFGADTKAVDKALAGVDRKVDGTARAATQRMGGFWSRQEQDSTRFGNAVGKAAAHAKKALIGLTAGAGIALGAMFISGVQGASDLAESANKIGAVFGDVADDVQAFAAGAARDLGQTRVQALDAAATFGTFGKAAGLAGNELSGFSTELVTLSADLASFYNTSPEDAIIAIGAALRGEAEPIRNYGVLLDDATLRQQALKMGLIETTKEALTPQQKVLAAHAEILKQTSDAQGDFTRTSDGLANQQRILKAQWAEMKTELGTQLLPVVTGFFGFLNNTGIPVMRDTGGAVKEAVQWFGDLPAPIQAATAAMVAFRIASATGVTGGLASGFRAAGSGLESLRLRAMFTADAFRDARAGQVHLTNGLVTSLTPSAGRASSALAGLKAGAMGAGGALRRGLGGAVAMFGGPWGIALAGATALVASFWAENKAAKQHVEDLTASLDQQTGALTDNSRELIYNNLQKAGAFEAARILGKGLDVVQRAAEGDADAIREMNQAIDEQLSKTQGAMGNLSGLSERTDEATGAAMDLAAILGDETGALAESRDALRDKREALGDTTDATDAGTEATKEASGAYRTYAERLRDARDRLRDLMDAENQRRLNAVKAKRDEIALIATIADTRKELREGTRTLDQNTEAGRDNWNALLDLADQWNNSTEKVRNAKGAYRDIRETFVELAGTVEDNDRKVGRLADRFLTLPSRKDIPVSVPGADEALRQLQAIRAEMAYVSMGGSFATPTEGRNRPPATSSLSGPGHAGGGYTGDGPKYQIAGPVHRGEFVFDQQKTRANRALFEAIHAGRPVRMGDVSAMTSTPSAAGTTVMQGGGAATAQRIVLDMGEGQRFRGVMRAEARAVAAGVYSTQAAFDADVDGMYG